MEHRKLIGNWNQVSSNFIKMKDFLNLKKKGLPTSFNHQHLYGTWSFFDDLSNRQHRLQITDKLEIMIDSKILPGKFLSINEHSLNFLDSYGYHLRINLVNGVPSEVYDEADDRSYPLKKFDI